MIDDIVKVGMADLNTAKPPMKLRTLGLGSCVGIILYDNKLKVGGLAHAMLPSSLELKDNKNRAKFVDTSIDQLISDMKEKGANVNNLVAKLAGGAQMFKFTSNSEILNIGERNAKAAREKLSSLNIKLIAEDTGGNFGRTITFNPEDGTLHVRTVGHGEKTI